MDELLQRKITELMTKISSNIHYFSLCQLVRILKAFSKKYDNSLKIFYRDNLKLAFSKSEVAAIDYSMQQSHANVFIDVNLLSIVGSTGHMPSHYKLTMLYAQKSHHQAPIDFINIFYNYLVNYYVEIALKYHPTVDNDGVGFRKLLSSILGSYTHQPLLNQTRFFMHKDRSIRALSDYLSEQTGYIIVVKNFVPYYHQMNSGEGLILDGNSCLGRNSWLGFSLRADAQHLSITITSLTKEQSVRLYSDFSVRKKLRQLISYCLGYSYRITFTYDIQNDINDMSLDGSKLLGINTVI